MTKWQRAQKNNGLSRLGKNAADLAACAADLAAYAADLAASAAAHLSKTP